MSLIDQTNRTILLSMEEQYDDDYACHPVTLSVDVDFESSLTPSNWVWLMLDSEEGPWFHMTYEEAGLLHDRLGLILGRSGAEAGK